MSHNLNAYSHNLNAYLTIISLQVCQQRDAALSRLAALVASKKKQLKSLSMFNATLEQDQAAWVEELEKTRQTALQNKVNNEKIIAKMSAEVEESMRLLM